MKRLIKSVLNKLGIEIRLYRRPSHQSRNEKMFAGLTRAKSLNLPVNTIVDVGAAAGTWCMAARELWPSSNFLLFEPLNERFDELTDLANRNENINFVPYAAGAREGSVMFTVSPDLDGSGVTSGTITGENQRTVKVSSIEHQVQELNLSGPYIIKLDTHGFEVPILEGCSSILPSINLFIIESYGFEIAENSLLFWEMCSYMDKLGFRLYNIVDVMHRKKDGAFWQCDAFFIKKNHHLFADKIYQ